MCVCVYIYILCYKLFIIFGVEASKWLASGLFTTETPALGVWMAAIDGLKDVEKRTSNPPPSSSSWRCWYTDRAIPALSFPALDLTEKSPPTLERCMGRVMSPKILLRYFLPNPSLTKFIYLFPRDLSPRYMVGNVDCKQLYHMNHHVWLYGLQMWRLNNYALLR